MVPQIADQAGCPSLPGMTWATTPAVHIAPFTSGVNGWSSDGELIIEQLPGGKPASGHDPPPAAPSTP